MITSGAWAGFQGHNKRIAGLPRRNGRMMKEKGGEVKEECGGGRGVRGSVLRRPRPKKTRAASVKPLESVTGEQQAAGFDGFGKAAADGAKQERRNATLRLDG